MQSNNLHNDGSNSGAEMERIIRDEEEETGTRRLIFERSLLGGTGLGASKPLTAKRRWILYPLRSAVRIVNRLLMSQPEETGLGRPGVLRRILGYTASRNDKLKETAWLDGLRGVAAFLVMVNHYNLDTFAFGTEAPYGATGTKPWEVWRLPYLRIIWCSGSTQVGIFFVLSGFVLSWSSLSSIREGRPEKFVLSLSSAAFRRWVRLFLPCFLIGLLSLLQFYIGLIDLPISRENYFFFQFVDYIWACERFANPFYLDRLGGWEVNHKYDSTMWTIPVEWGGSLVVFMVLLMVCRVQNYARRTLVLFVISLYCCLSTKWNFWLFTTGTILADYVKQAGGFDQLSDQLSGASRLFWIFVLLVGGWLGGIPGNYGFFDRPGYAWTDRWIPASWQTIEHGQRFYWCLSGIMIIWAVSHFRPLRRFFELPFCRYLGRISFMLYLTHRMIGNILGGPIRQELRNVFGTLHKVEPQQETEIMVIHGFFWNIVAYALAWAIMLPLALGLANWSTRIVDEPSVNFAKWVDDKFVNGFVPEIERRMA